MEITSFYPLMIGGFFFVLILIFSLFTCIKLSTPTRRPDPSILSLNPFIGLFLKTSPKSRLLRFTFISSLTSLHLLLILIYLTYLDYFEYENIIKSSIASVFAFICSKPLTILRLVSEVRKFKTEMKLFILLVFFFLALAGLGYFALKNLTVDTRLWVLGLALGIAEELLLESLIMLCRSTIAKIEERRKRRVKSEKNLSTAKMATFFKEDDGVKRKVTQK